jgi:glutamate racemase
MRQKRVLQGNDNRPIGVFDSGVGGLTVVKELTKQLPEEDIIYFGDTARVPYGTKSRQAIIRFSIENALFLLKHNVKLIVAACNTSSSVSLTALRRNFKVPILGVIDSGAKEATVLTRNKRIGVIGTTATITSNAYAKQILKIDTCFKVFSQSCPLLVPLAEEGKLSGKITRDIVRSYITPLKSKGIDTLILGCTHYPLLKKSIVKITGKNIMLIDSAISMARSVKILLKKENMLNKNRLKGCVDFFVSDAPLHFKNIGEKFLGKELINVRKTDHGI